MGYYGCRLHIDRIMDASPSCEMKMPMDEILKATPIPNIINS